MSVYKAQAMFLLFLAKLTFEWWDSGHRSTARIAQLELTKEQNQWITDLLNLWPGEEGNIIDISSWQDDIKGIQRRVYVMSNWHFANEPFINATDMSVLQIPPETYNVSNVIRDCIETINNPSTVSPWALSFAIRCLIHFIGDSHCPVHSIALFSERFPTSDRGGNSYYLDRSNLGDAAANVHKLWDSAGLSHQTYLPIVDFEHNVSEILQKYPRSELQDELSKTDPYSWVRESYAVARKYAYNVSMNHVPSQDYLLKARDVCHMQFALGGYRLADVLKNFFEKRGLIDLNQGTSNRVSEIIGWTLSAICVVAIILFSIFDRFFCKKDIQKILVQTLNT
ncbi:class I nuclease [Histomonas meleagridis]|uniref:class I nuclease n=1 Tax=Histomonas meleagridis TaxID=135588 RepID=UPI003559EE90|nr:class I nuclease [Histomonas meleagridis]KAH0804007.1 class I nuclease [Histomonas meleagridis]